MGTCTLLSPKDTMFLDWNAAVVLQTGFFLVQKVAPLLSVMPAVGIVLPKGNSSLAGTAVSHELFPAPVAGITLKSQVVIQSVLISETGFLICYVQISLIFRRRVCDWLKML